MQVVREPRSLLFGESGARVSNAWITYLRVRDNQLKGGLIPNTIIRRMLLLKKAGQLAPIDRSASHQLVGRVTAYQGYDG